MKKDKPLTDKQKAKLKRDQDIKLDYMSLVPSQRSVRKVASYYKVSRMTAYYAIFGRDHKDSQQ